MTETARHTSAAVAVASLALAAALSAAAPEPSSPSAFEQDGFRVEMELSPMKRSSGGPARAWEDVELSFEVREAMGGGEAVAGLGPMAWLMGRDAGEPAPDLEGCKYQIRSLLAGRLARIADVNLNEYHLITLDDNNTISIIDPQIESSKTKTLGIVTLSSRGEDFVLAPDRRRVLVTLPTQGRVASADLFKRVARYLDLGGRPWRLALAPDGRFAWVGDETGDAITAIDVATFARTADFEVGPGPHRFAFDADSTLAFVASPNMPDVAIIDVATMALVDQVDIGGSASAVSYSAHSGRVYAARGDGVIVVIDPETAGVVASVVTGKPLVHFAVAPGGRTAFAVHQADDAVTVIDLASHQASHTVVTEGGPDHVDFTDTFAYVRHAETGDMTLLDYRSLSTGGPPMPAPVVIGRRAPTDGMGPMSAPLFAAVPEGGGALVLNTADRSVYHFMEGMNAPMGSYRTYPWTARGVLVADRTIRETDRGRYQTEFRLPKAGQYTLAFLVPDSPQLYGCFDVSIPSPQEGPVEYRSVDVDVSEAHPTLQLGAPAPLQVRLVDPASRKPIDGLEDVFVLVQRLPTWHWRHAARGVGDGRYQVDVPFPDAGRYLVLVRARSRGAEFGDMHSFSVDVEAAPASDDAASASTTHQDSPELLSEEESR